MNRGLQTIYHLTYIVGYAQLLPSRSVRRRIAGSRLHRAWLAGNQGCIGEPEGVLYRLWHTNRKQHKNATIKQIWQCMRDYYGLSNCKEDHFLFATILRDIRDH